MSNVLTIRVNKEIENFYNKKNNPLNENTLIMNLTVPLK